ncbi:hypothetical protein IDM40_18465 [Nocardiopsis sp. HNM0947]|uniref:Aldehyde-activating protein n=1 Tax=Nocardiopsis coralli TaxID=2772213 RepID=A0ABR9PA03_9ACTN|nr:hypothetical protein [Nocardiopsis coralli]MBE3000669.1 hypothetical protein [Nocardiopsis coralli]
MTTPTCTCGSTSFEEGFIDDVAQGAVRWISGSIEFGMLGFPKRGGDRDHRFISALCCTRCGVLTLRARLDI